MYQYIRRWWYSWRRDRLTNKMLALSLMKQALDPNRDAIAISAIDSTISQLAVSIKLYSQELMYIG